MTPTSTTLPPDASATPTPKPERKPGLLRNGNHQGNPNLAPRCGAKARTTGCPCRGPAMPNGRCRMHGGTSTGPRTPQGMARMIAALTKHGLHGAAGAPQRAKWLYVRKVNVRGRLTAQAMWWQAYLPPDMAARLDQGPEELWPPKHPSNLPFVNPTAATPYNQTPCANPKGRRSAAAPTATPTNLALRARQTERQAARAEAAALKPWRAAIAAARAAKKTARAAAPRPATGPTRPARSNALRPETPARPTGSPARQPAPPPPARTAQPTPTSTPRATTPRDNRPTRLTPPPATPTPATRPNPAPRRHRPASKQTLTTLTPTKAEALRTTTLAETWDHAATRATLDALFGRTPRPGWHPPQASPPGWRPPPASPTGTPEQKTETRPQRGPTPRAGDRSPSDPTPPHASPPDPRPPTSPRPGAAGNATVATRPQQRLTP